jgi:creatine kinase
MGCNSSSEVDYPPTGLHSGVKKLPQWIQLGCGDVEYICAEKGATFSSTNLPDELPDLSEHQSFCTDVIKQNPGVYAKYKDMKTKLDVNIGHCIKTGIDNKGHPMIKACGLVAGDEESWTLFADIMEPVLSLRHGGYAADAKHPTDMDITKISTRKIDPTGKYVLTTRCRTGRSIRGFRLPPCNSFQERRDIEALIVKGLMSLEGDLAGEYFPLSGSRSYAPKPKGMPEAYAKELMSKGNLFQEPDSTLLLSSGCGRHWPDARGIFHNKAKNFFVWINEEDHSRIISMEEGDNVHSIFKRFCDATSAIKEVLVANGADFMHSDHLGFILTCPSNCGTGLRAGCMCLIPLFSARPDFKDVCGRLRLQARGGAGVDSEAKGGKFDISNADRLGHSEVTLVNMFIHGVANILRWEVKLGAGEDIEDEVTNAKAGECCYEE